MSLRELLEEKLDSEIAEFRASYNKLSVAETYNDWYVIGFMEEYFDALSSDNVSQRLGEKEMSWLTSKEKPLSFLYDFWMGVDGAMDHDWEAIFDFVRNAYNEEKRMVKRDLYHEIKTLDLNPVKDFDDTQFDYFCHITDNPNVFSAQFDNNFDSSVDKIFGEFFKNKLSVKCCDFGCDTYPHGVSKEVAPGNTQTYQQQVWNFIEDVERMFGCKCTYFNEVNGFEFVIAFGKGENKGCYVFGAGNNGQEFSECLYLTNWELIQSPEFSKTLLTIDKAFCVLLEENDLRLNNARATSLEDKIKEARSEKSNTFEGNENNKAQEPCL